LFIFRFIRRVISFILLLIIVVPLYVAGSIWYSARNSEAVKSDVILVMGAAQFDGRPSDILQSRLKESLQIYKSGLAPRIYTIGSGAPGDRTTEAAASKNWLINNGVKKSNILSITKGRDTLSSTQAYAAAMKMATDLGLTASCDPVKTGPASVTNSGYKYLARETGAYLAYITVGRLGIKLSDRLFAENLYS